MGLDIALGVIALLWALRGWLKGFVDQAVQLGGIVASVYVAGPLRDALMPRLSPKLPSVDPMVLEKLVWWSSAAISFVVIVGLASTILKLSRRRPAGLEPEPSYSDQSAGLLLGLVKAAVAFSFALAAVDQYALGFLKGAEWSDKYVATSYALTWARDAKPAERIWKCQPVRLFVAEIKKSGVEMKPTKSSEKSDDTSAISALPEGDSTKSLELPKFRDGPSGIPPKLELDADLDARIEKFREQLKKTE